MMHHAYFLRFRLERATWGVVAVFLFIFVFSAAQAQNTTSFNALKDTIEQKKDSIERIKREIGTYEQSIRLRQAQAASLSNQILILNDQIQRLELSVRATEEEIETVGLEITETERLIAEREQAGDLDILLAYDTVSDYFNDLENVEQLQAHVGDTVREFERLRKDAELTHETLTAKQQELETLRAELDTQQFNLSSQRTVKAQVLVDTRRSETQYQKQLRQAKQEQAAAEAEVVSVEKKLRETIKEGARLERLRALGAPNFTWPIASRTITAYFHDPDYPYRYVFEHPAIDIATKQGTPVRAAAGGYVAKAKGVCNAYVMIIHDQGYATVYGHLSKVSVKDDDFVEQGQIIGLSGGMPRTCCSGNLTTGPHLHFEVRREGLPMNPLDYL